MVEGNVAEFYLLCRFSINLIAWVLVVAFKILSMRFYIFKRVTVIILFWELTKESVIFPPSKLLLRD